MRIFSVALALTWMLAGTASADYLRVATCELNGLEAPLTETAAERQANLLRQAASSLKPIDAEVIIVHGLPDRKAARHLASLLKPATYHVAYHGVFKQNGSNGPPVGPPLTVLTRKMPFAARSIDWRLTGQIDWPGGFAFIGIKSGTTSVCVYVAHLPGERAGIVDRENAILARRRDLAAYYLLHHANWFARTLTNQLVCALVTGDFITDPHGTRSEGAVRILQQAGFKPAQPAKVDARAEERFNDRTEAPPLLTAMLARNAEWIGATQAATRDSGTWSIASYEVEPTAAPTPGNGGVRPVPARVVALDRSIVWLWIGGISALCVASFFSVWLMRRTFSAAGILGRRLDPALNLARSPFRARRERALGSDGLEETYLRGTSYAAEGVATRWQARAVQAEQRAADATALLRENARPQLNRLLRDRLIRWLSWQRGALLASHDVGTKQVLELETRLQQIQAQFQERLRNREDRIADLERDLRSKEKIIRDLLRAQVRLASESPPD